jgi:thioesterase domain-containing protein
MQRQDYIERMIAQIAEAVGRIMGLARSVQPEEAEREIASTWTRVLGFRRADLDRLDPGTLRALLGAKHDAAITLIEAEAQLRREQARDDEAERLTRLAAQLRG